MIKPSILRNENPGRLNSDRDTLKLHLSAYELWVVFGLRFLGTKLGTEVPKQGQKPGNIRQLRY
jgi:hypothetical protein